MSRLGTANQPDHAVFKATAKLRDTVRERTWANNKKRTQAKKKTTNHRDDQHLIISVTRDGE
ncbi:hypothetical protein EB083_03040 [bacterium]|nr:hypothetical protein [bacterium]